jgi:glycosyltransferase involved in cell wall biosynthesis
MRIGISTSVIQRGQSGIGQYVISLVRALCLYADRHSFTLFVLEDDLPLFAFAQGQMKLIPVSERFRPAIRNILWHQLVLPGLVREFQLDVLHTPSYRRMLWRQPCPLVATIHDLAPFRLAHKYDPLRMFYGRTVARRLAHRQDEIIAVSENSAQDVATFFGVPTKRIHVVYNGVDHERFFPGNHEVAKATVAGRHGVNGPFFLYVARLEHPAKNHVRLVEAFNEYKSATHSPWRLVLAGSDWHGAGKIHEAIQLSKFRHDIHCLGFVPDSDIPDLYRAADVFVYPSLFEGFGLPPIEAMACGCPVISSDRGALGEMLGAAAAIINPEEVSDLRFQMARMASDADLRNRWRTAGLARAQCFHWQKTVTGTLEVYGHAITNAPSARHAFALAH